LFYQHIDLFFDDYSSKYIKAMCHKLKCVYRVSSLLFLLAMSAVLYGQSPHKNLRQGDKYYYQNNYVQAEEAYRKALQDDEKSVNANHNLGNALYNQERYEEAVKYFENAAITSTNEAEKADAYHNLGNAYLSQVPTVEKPEQGQEVLQKSIEAYKQSLKNNPNDDATRYNLAYAQNLFRQLQQQQQQQQEQEQQQGQGGGQSEEENPSSPNNDGNNQQNDNKKEPKPKPSEGQAMSKSEAERLIQIMQEQERRVQEKMNRKKQQTNPSGKDW
jgi:tetratricopeptide (TPR) repeat protein